MGKVTTMDWRVPASISISDDERGKVDLYIAFDGGKRRGRRRIRPTQGPDFQVNITQVVDGEHRALGYEATIVACSPLLDGSTVNIAPGTPLAVAEVYIDGESWYMLISAAIDNEVKSLHNSEVLIRSEEAPEVILQEPLLFERMDY